MTDIQIRELRREDMSLVRKLYATTKNRLRAEAYDRWCFFDTPWGDPVGVIAVDRDLCVSIFILRPTMLDIGGEDVLGAQATDLMTHPNYRGRGLFVSVVEECFRIAATRGFEAVYAFPNPNSYPGFIRRLNFAHVGDVFAWEHNLWLLRMSLPVWGARKREAAVEELRSIEPAELQSLIRASNNERDVCRIKRDQAWLTWRYAKASSEMYQWYAKRSPAGEIQAAILVGERDDSWGGLGKDVLRIHEAFAYSEDALATLLTALIRRAREASKMGVRMFVKDARIESVLRRAKFRTAELHPLIVRRLTTRRFSANVHHHPAWRIVGGDFDAF